MNHNGTNHIKHNTHYIYNTYTTYTQRITNNTAEYIIFVTVLFIIIPVVFSKTFKGLIIRTHHHCISNVIHQISKLYISATDRDIPDPQTVLESAGRPQDAQSVI